MDEVIQFIKGLPDAKRKLLAEFLLSDVQSSQSEPIAIIGIGCRFPGEADDPASFWRLLCDGVDAITEVPSDRWDADTFYDPDAEIPGRAPTKWGGFVRDVETFDPSFFSITPREAVCMDPQQRLLLEVAWEAFEDAGLDVNALRGSSTGVFVGASMVDYWRQLQTDVPSHLEKYDMYAATGTSLCIAANRLSYCFHLTGPSMVLDTACSSSLVAVHQACRSLRSEESTLAIAGGVNLTLLPSTGVLLGKFMAPDGRCKAFDARADGFVRGEGVGVLVLKRLDRAQADGDPVYAVIRGSAVNQDGFSSGLTVPNGKAQQQVIEAALRDAGMTADALDYIEAHGTGTALGDPIEAAALGAVLGKRSSPCRIGSVKTNLGHLEAAAGIAGLIKTVLALHHRQLPRSLHFSDPNPAIAFDDLSLKVQQQHEPWAVDGKPRTAGVSSFGIGGTNAHVIVQEAPPRKSAAAGEPPSGPCLLPISARNGAALEALAADYERYLSAQAPALADVCYSAACRRAHHEHRYAVLGQTHQEIRQGLAALTGGESSVPSRLLTGRPRVVFSFCGQGGHWPGMGQAQAERRPVFAELLERCDATLRPMTGWSLLDELRADADFCKLGRTDIGQPALVALQIALARQWQAWGIVPDAVIGHSVGEIAAVHVAGGLTLEDALTIAYHRGRLMQGTAGQGAMVAVAMSEAEVRSLLAEQVGATDLWVAAINGPRSTTLSGDPRSVDALLERLGAEGIRSKRLDVDYAFHGPQMDPLRAPLIEALRGIRSTPVTIPVYSTVTGERRREGQFDAAYWSRGMRDAVRFAPAMTGAIEDGHRLFLEIGPHRVLAAPILECLEQHGAQGLALASLRRGHPREDTMLRSLAELYMQGFDVEFSDVFAPGGRLVRLPSYPWQRKRYWIPAPELTHPEATPHASIPSEYYDALTETTHDQTGPAHDEAYLVFAPFPEIQPDLSWLHFLLSPHSYTHRYGVVLAAQREMKAALFRHVDFSKVECVMDYGCGYASDLITLAARHWHLALYGYSISAKQIEVGQQKAQRRELADRVHLFRRDSAKDEFPSAFELAFGFEVTHHIKDKESLFGNIGRNLNPDGKFVVADFISNAEFSVDHELTSSYFSTRQEWATLLASQDMEVVDCVDVSYEIGNFIYDERFEDRLVELSGEQPDPNIIAACRSYIQLGKMLHKGLASYVLLTAVKTQAPSAGLRDENYRRLGQRIPYDEVACGRWAHELRWRPVAPEHAAAPAGTSPVSGGRWIVFADEDVAPSLERYLTANGGACVMVTPGDGFGRLGASNDVERYQIDPREPEHYRQLLAAALADGDATPGQVLYLWGSSPSVSAEADAAAIMRAQQRASGGVLHLVQALSAMAGSRSRRLWLVTRKYATDQPDAGALMQAPLVGLGRVIEQEHPDIWGGLIDIDPAEVAGGAQGAEAVAEALCATVSSVGSDKHVALRDGQRLVPRLVRCEGLQMMGDPLRLRADATYLVTGGFGALGIHLVNWMAEHGAAHIAILGRSEPSVSAQALIDTMKQRGVQIHPLRADVSEHAELDQALRALAQAGPPLAGVVHAAGVIDDGVLLKQQWRRFEGVFAPKVAGAWNLHRLTESMKLDFFVMYSSAAAVLGNGGQASYAAANAFLDTLAAYRRSRGLPGTSIAWGPWRAAGMTQSLDGRVRARWQQRGIGEISPDQGMLVLEWLLQSDVPYACVLPLSFTPAVGEMPLLSEIVPRLQARASHIPAQPSAPPSVRQRLEQSYPSERMAILSGHIREQIERVLGIERDVEIEPHKPLLDLGMDSLMAVELRNNLSKSLALKLPASLLFDHPTWQALSEHIGYDVVGLERPGDGAAGSSALERELDQLEHLSDEEAEALLAAHLEGEASEGTAS
ncbi:MAG: type I polyketide synthase [Myxococcota bacterium]